MSKILVSLLMLSIPLNFIAIEGIGNLYFSTILIFLEFIFLFLITKARIIKKPNTFLALSFVFLFVITTVINMVFDQGEFLKMQTVFLVVYAQNILVFIVIYYLMDKISMDYFFKFFLFIMFLASFRVLIEEPDRIFLFSTVWGERIEAAFIGGVNNFALLIGVVLIISFFYIKKKSLRTIFCAFWLCIIALTMSRGALLGVVFTLFAVAIYDSDRKTLKTLIKFSIILCIIGVVALFYFNKVDVVIDQFNDRFLSIFTGEKSIKSFSSGRIDVWSDMLSRIWHSSFFEILFGHGVGSIDFMVLGHLDYESSHNIFIDLIYRNGILVCILYFLLVSHLFWLFIKNRSRNKLALFGVFVFLHFELLVNPVLFAAQTGWLYCAFLVLFIKQEKLTNESSKRGIIEVDQSLKT